MAAGPCQFYVLVLAVPPGSSYNFWGLIAAGEAPLPNFGQNEDRAWQWASHQLAHELDGLRKLGVDADGEAGEPHPVRAISEVLAKRPADEIILATSRHLLARMMAMDLPHRVQRHFGLPVTVLGVARKQKT